MKNIVEVDYCFIQKQSQGKEENRFDRIYTQKIAKIHVDHLLSNHSLGLEKYKTFIEGYFVFVDSKGNEIDSVHFEDLNKFSEAVNLDESEIIERYCK